MDRKQFLEQVKRLRAVGKSIRAIALELNVHRSRVERALREPRRLQADESVPAFEYARPRNLLEKGEFVGRHQDLRELRSALEDALSGQGRLVMLAGEPGIGKTRTAQELAAISEQRNAWVLWGRCHAEHGAPPYWPWVQVIRSYLQRRKFRRVCAPRWEPWRQTLPK
jgi:predicted NACHT family NTPase